MKRLIIVIEIFLLSCSVWAKITKVYMFPGWKESYCMKLIKSESPSFSGNYSYILRKGKYGILTVGYKNHPGGELYFDVDKRFIFRGVDEDGNEVSNLYLLIEFFSEGNHTFEVYYDSSSGISVLPPVSVENSGKYKIVVLTLNSPFFGNRCPNGADFFIKGGNIIFTRFALFTSPPERIVLINSDNPYSTVNSNAINSISIELEVKDFNQQQVYGKVKVINESRNDIQISESMPFIDNFPYRIYFSSSLQNISAIRVEPVPSEEGLYDKINLFWVNTVYRRCVSPVNYENLNKYYETGIELRADYTNIEAGNLIYNSSFEYWNSTSPNAVGWESGSHFARTNSRFHTGGYSMLASGTGIGGDSIITVTSVPVYKDTLYKFSAWIFNAASSGSAYVDMKDFPGEASLVSTPGNNNWEYLETLWYCNKTTNLKIRCVVDNSFTGQVWFDDLFFGRVTIHTEEDYSYIFFKDRELLYLKNGKRAGININDDFIYGNVENLYLYLEVYDNSPSFKIITSGKTNSFTLGNNTQEFIQSRIILTNIVCTNSLAGYDFIIQATSDLYISSLWLSQSELPDIIPAVEPGSNKIRLEWNNELYNAFEIFAYDINKKERIKLTETPLIGRFSYTYTPEHSGRFKFYLVPYMGDYPLPYCSYSEEVNFTRSSEEIFSSEVEIDKNILRPGEDINFSVKLREGRKVFIGIFSVTGEKIDEVIDTYLNEGIHQFTWRGNSVKNLKTGVYLIRYRIGDMVHTRKIIIVR